VLVRREVRGKDKLQQPIFATCGRCNGAGGSLNDRAARKALWLSKSPMYRADGTNLLDFEGKVAALKQDPRKIPEFIRSVRILSVDYHGLWALAKYAEKGYDNESRREFNRNVSAMLLRIGRNWYFFDDKTDADFLTGKAGGS
jgi:hypothetical protein